MSKRPQVRDFTTDHTSVQVAVEASAVYELLLALFVWGNTEDSEEYECGSIFFEQLESAIPATLGSEIERMAGCGEIWLSLVGLAYASNATTSVAAFLEFLEHADPVTIRKALIDGACNKSGLTDEEAVAAAEGDSAAVAKIVSDKRIGVGLRDLVESDVAVTKRWVVDTLTGAYDALAQNISDTLPALRRDAGEKRSLAHSMDTQKLVETATNGVTFEPQPHIVTIVLIPSKIIRPWTVIIEHEGIRLFAYSVSDEHLNADPDAPPRYLVDLYKALGDERRLRMLSILADGDAGLAEIAERASVAKSTAHHHLRMLRSAGLVRVTVGSHKAYSLRRDRLPEAVELLDAYLTTPTAPAPVTAIADAEGS